MKKNRPTSGIPAAIFAGLIFFFYLTSTAPSIAQTADTWSGNGGPAATNWNNAANWSAGNQPPVADDYLTFAGANVANSNDYAAGTIFGNVVFASGASSFTLSGNGVVLTNSVENGTPVAGFGSVTNLSANAQTISLPLTLSAGNHIISTGSGAGALNFSGPFSRNADGTAQFVQSGGSINFNGSGLSTVNGILGGWAVTGLGVNAGDWATLSSGNIAAYSSYTTKSGGTSMSLSASGGNAANNIKINTRSSTASTLNSTTSGTYDINTLLWSTGSTPGGDQTLNITSGQTLRLGANGAIMNVHSDNRTFNVGNSTSSSAITAGGAANTAGELSLCSVSFANGSARLQIKSPVTDNGTGKVSVNTLGDVQFTMANTYSGGISINIGRAWANNVTGYGTGPVYIYPGGEAALNAGGTFANNFFIAGWGSSGIADPMAIRQTSSGCTISGTVTLMGPAVIGPTGNNLTLSGNITGPGGLYTLGSYGNGSLHLDESTPNTYAGDTTIDAVGIGNDTGHAITIWIDNSTHNNIMPNGSGAGNLILKGNSSSTLAQFDLGGSTQTVNGLISSGTAIADSVTSNPGGGTLNVGGNNATSEFDGTIGSAFGTGTANVNVAKIGAGTLTLGGTNNYTGTTTVNGGTLALKGTGTIGASPQVFVNNSTLDISSASSPYAGASSLLMTNGTFRLATVQASAVATLAMSNSTVSLVLNQSSANITASVLVTGGSTNVILFTSVPGFNTYPGQFPVIKYSPGGFVNVDVNNNLTNLGANLPALGNPVGYLTNNTANNSIDLVLVSGPPPLEPITWNGATNGVPNGNWDLLTTSNWIYNGGPYLYQDTSVVTFDDSLHGTTNVNLATTLSPGSVTVNNTLSNYVFSGTGRISGSTSLNMTGSGTLTLTETGGDNFSGGIVVNSGAVIIDNNSSGISGGITVAGSGTLQLGNNDANGVLPAGSVADSGAVVLNRSDSVLNVANTISGTGKVANNGSGTVTLSTANSFSGGLTVNSGTLQVTSVGSGNTALGGTVDAFGSSVTVNSGAVLVGLGGDAFGYQNVASTSPASLIINGGTVTDVGTANYRITLPNLTFTGGTLTSAPGNLGDTEGNYSLLGTSGGCIVTAVASSTAAVISAAKISFQNPTFFNVAAGTTPSGVDLLVSSTIVPYGNQALTINNSGAGVVAFDTNNTYPGTTTINGGTLQLGMPSDPAPLTSVLSTNTVSDNALLSLASGKGVTVANAISGTGSLLVVSGTNVLTAADTYGGGTTVNAGKLSLTGAGSINNSSSITVSNATFDVSGMSAAFANPNFLTLTNATFNLGTNLAPSLNSLTLGNATLIFPLNLTTANISAGTLATAGTTNLVQITSIVGFNNYPVQFPVIKYSGEAAGVVDVNNNLTTLGVQLPALGSPVGYLTNNTVNNSIDLVLVSGPPLIEPITWNGQSNSVNNGNWDILVTPDWLPTGSNAPPYVYQDGSPVTFDDMALGMTSVSLLAALKPAGITVSNSAKTYTFSGVGAIAGSTGLFKTNSGSATFAETGGDSFTGGITMGGGMLTYSATGVAISGGVTNEAGALILDEAGTFSGATTIAGGATVQVGNNDARGVLPSGGVADIGSLAFNRTDAFTTANAISGTGSLANNGSGTNTLSASNSYTGATAINSGTVTIANYNAFGTASTSVANGAVTVASGATLDLSGIAANAAPGLGVKLYNIAGTGVGGAGAIVNNNTSGGLIDCLNNVTLTANATIGGSDNAQAPGTNGNSGHGRFDIGRDITTGSTLNLNGFTLTKEGNNMVNFARYTTTTAGDIVWNGGVLSVDTGPGVFTDTSPGSFIIMDANSIFETFNTPAGSILTPMVFNGPGITAGESAGNATGTISSPVYMNNTVSFVERNGVTTGNVLLAGPVSDVSSGLSTTLAGNSSLPSVAAGAGSINVNGTTLTLAGTNTYTGATTVSAGTLALTNNGSISNSPTITVASGATLDASKRVDAMLTLPSGQSLIDNGNVANSVIATPGSSVTVGGMLTGNVTETNALVTVNSGGDITGGVAAAGGTVTVNGTVSGNVTLTGAALFGDGTVSGNLQPDSTSTISPGAVAGLIGTLTVGQTVTFDGVTLLKIDKALSPSNDVLAANTILYGGALNVTNLDPGHPLAAGDSFKIFNSGIIVGSFAATNLPPLAAGLAWTNILVNGTISVVGTVNTNPTNFTATLSGNVLMFAWPSDHTGWRLLEQTNHLATGISANIDDWMTVPGSAATNQISVTNGPSNEFYKMVYP